MPTYEYACRSCDHRFEIVQSFSEDTLTTCPECDREQLRKVYNAAGIIFKGDGWHIKDYASKGKASSSTSGAADTKAADTASSSTAAKGGTTKDSGSSETKAAS